MTSPQVRMSKEKGPDLFPPKVQDEIVKNLTDLVQNGKMFRYEVGAAQIPTTPTGEVAKLEKDFAEYIGRKFAVAVNSCASGMFLALKAGGFKAGDKCFTNAFTFTAVPSCIVHAGGRPILIECTRRFTMDLNDLRQKIKENPDVKYMVLSHMRGHVNDMDTIMDLCKENGIFVVDDCAHGHGAKWDGKILGSFGPPIACFSAQSMKMMNSGEGGIVVTDDDRLAAYCMIGAGCYEANFTKHLLKPSSEAIEELRYVVPCYSMRMSALTAAVLHPQVALLKDKVETYRGLYAQLEKKLNTVQGVEVPKPLPKARRAPNSIQFHIVGVDKSQLDSFLKKCTARGLSMQIFGHSNNARYYKNWQYAYENPKATPECKTTDSILFFACDLRLCLHYTQEDVEIMGKIIEEEINELMRNKA